jgi:hypothetical protein
MQNNDEALQEIGEERAYNASAYSYTIQDLLQSLFLVFHMLESL